MRITRNFSRTAISILLLACAAPLSAQEAAPKVSIAAAYTEDITQEAVFVGRAEAINQVDIVARVQGFLLGTRVKDGSEVTEDQLLFEIEPDLYEATLAARNADLDKAKADLELRQVELARKEELLKRQAVPVSERDIARANELVAEAQVKSAESAIAQAKLDLGYTKITAPFAGRIGRISVSEGDVVGPSTGPIVSLVSEAPIYVTFSLNEKQLINILESIGEPTTTLDQAKNPPAVKVELANGTLLDEVGKIAFADNRIDPLTGAIALRAEFANDKGLIVDGAFVHVHLQANEASPALLVPQAAVQRDQRGEFVLVVNDQQMVEQRYITTDGTYETAFIVTDGLREGESVIVEGLQRVRPGVAVDAVLAGGSGN